MATIRTQLPMFSAIQWLSDGFSDMRATQFKGTYYGLVFTLVAFIISFIYAIIKDAILKEPSPKSSFSLAKGYLYTLYMDEFINNNY